MLRVAAGASASAARITADGEAAAAAIDAALAFVALEGLPAESLLLAAPEPEAPPGWVPVAVPEPPDQPPDELPDDPAAGGVLPAVGSAAGGVAELGPELVDDGGFDDGSGDD